MKVERRKFSQISDGRTCVEFSSPEPREDCDEGFVKVRGTCFHVEGSFRFSSVEEMEIFAKSVSDAATEWQKLKKELQGTLTRPN